MTQDRNFHKSCQKMGDEVGENPAALRAAVFLLSAKNRRGGVQPPSRAKLNIQLISMRPYLHRCSIFEMQTSDPQGRHRILPVPSWVGLMLRCFGVQNQASQNPLYDCWLMAQAIANNL